MTPAQIAELKAKALAFRDAAPSSVTMELTNARDQYRRAANPQAILELLAERKVLVEALELFTTASMGETRYPGSDRESTHIGWQLGQGMTASERVAIARKVLKAHTGSAGT